MKILVLFFALMTSNSLLAFDLKPGLWSVNATFKQGDKFVDPMAEVRKALAKMPKEQQEQMMKMMKNQKMPFGISGEKITTCLSKEMIDKNKHLNHSDKDGCKTKVTSRTDKKFVTEFKCESGNEGTAAWTIMSDKRYTGIIDMKDKKGQENQIKYDMNFVKTDCGDVKPANPNS